MTATVYADFADPMCYLASLRADRALAAGLDIRWRAVSADPRLTVDPRRPADDERRRLADRITALGRLLVEGEAFDCPVPTFVPSTRAAVAAYAEAVGAGVGDEVRRLLFDLYWQQQLDIGDPNVLRGPLSGPFLRGHSDADPVRRFGYAVSPARGPITLGAHRAVRLWRAEWRELGDADLPLVLIDGATLAGTDAVLRLGKELVVAGAEVVPAADAVAEARRYPDPPLRVAPTWASRVGGRWLYGYRAAGAGR